ncbi:MAG TPA: hypothetical protein VGV12_16725 [Gemmatimonadales bacterium]|nr:hypothetical protein [Gemmatimonadales bacterium]
MIELFREAQALQRFLTERGWSFCFIGGVVWSSASRSPALAVPAPSRYPTVFRPTLTARKFMPTIVGTPVLAVPA